MGVLDHTPDTERAVAQMHRLLKPFERRWGWFLYAKAYKPS